MSSCFFFFFSPAVVVVVVVDVVVVVVVVVVVGCSCGLGFFSSSSFCEVWLLLLLSCPSLVIYDFLCASSNILKGNPNAVLRCTLLEERLREFVPALLRARSLLTSSTWGVVVVVVVVVVVASFSPSCS